MNNHCDTEWFGCEGVFNTENMAQGMTRAQLAEKISVNPRCIEAWEQRRVLMRDVNAGTIFTISKVLGCTMEELLADRLAQTEAEVNAGQQEPPWN